MKKDFIYFMKKIPKLDDRGFKVSTIDVLQLGNFLQFFFDKFGKDRKYKSLHFPM